MRPLARPLSIGPPYGAEGAMFRAAPGRLHGAPHVLALGQQVPARAREAVCLDPSAFIDCLWRTVDTVIQHLAPRDVAITSHHGMRGAPLEGLLRVQRGVHATEDDPCASLARKSPNLISAQR